MLRIRVPVIPKNYPHFEIYQSTTSILSQRWRWKMFVSGREIAASSEGYETRTECLKNLKNLEDHIKWLRDNGKLI